MAAYAIVNDLIHSQKFPFDQHNKQTKTNSVTTPPVDGVFDDMKSVRDRTTIVFDLNSRYI